MGSIKVNNDDVWNEYIKNKKVKGFSVEGYFVDKMQKKENKYSNSLKEIEEEEAKELLSDITNIIINKKGKKTKILYYSDYPTAIRNNAKKGLELNKKLDKKCLSTINTIRARRLSKGHPISGATIKRMNNYLIKAEENFDVKDKDSCLTVNFLLWGGVAAKNWSTSKLKKII
jgi:glycyl-tRNA synthetase beta subunit